MDRTHGGSGLGDLGGGSGTRVVNWKTDRSGLCLGRSTWEMGRGLPHRREQVSGWWAPGPPPFRFDGLPGWVIGQGSLCPPVTGSEMGPSDPGLGGFGRHLRHVIYVEKSDPPIEANEELAIEAVEWGAGHAWSH